MINGRFTWCFGCSCLAYNPKSADHEFAFWETLAMVRLMRVQPVHVGTLELEAMETSELY